MNELFKAQLAAHAQQLKNTLVRNASTAIREFENSTGIGVMKVKIGRTDYNPEITDALVDVEITFDFSNIIE